MIELLRKTKLTRSSTPTFKSRTTHLVCIRGRSQKGVINNGCILTSNIQTSIHGGTVDGTCQLKDI